MESPCLALGGFGRILKYLQVCHVVLVREVREGRHENQGQKPIAQHLLATETKQLAAPKAKYVEHILNATHGGEAGVAEVFRTLTSRLRDSTWTIVFKSLIIVHMMIKEGQPRVTLSFLAEAPSKLAISNFSDVQIQGANIRHYYNYLLSRAKSYRDTQTDWVREGKGRLKRQPVEKGLLRETESVQKQVAALLKCDLFAMDTENEISLTAFRLLTIDLLSLFHVMNEGTIAILERYFEMSRVDAERSLNIYKTFTRQTEEVVAFLGIARQYENATRLEIPRLKHAPTSLTNALEEYLQDPDFEVNRRQYVAQQEVKRGSKGKSSSKAPVDDFKKLNLNSNATSSQPKATQSASKPPEPKGPAPDLIDFFESIEQNQQPMAAGSSQLPVQDLPAIPQYQFQQASGFPGAQASQPAAPQFDDSNPFASMVAQQHTQNIGRQNGGPFTMQPQQTQAFPPSQLQPQLQDPSAMYQQSSSFINGQVTSPQNFAPNQQPPFGPPQHQQTFPTGQTQNSFNPQQLQSFSTGQSVPQATNPFRLSTMPTQFTNSSSSSPLASSAPPSNLTPQSTNPFHRSLATQTSFPTPPNSFSPSATTAPSVFSQPPMLSPQAFASANSQPHQPQPQQQQPQPLQPTRTGTNPFARQSPAPMNATIPPPASLAPQATGTNPFRQSVFVNQQTGQGWQTHQGTMGGLEKLDTIPVFPRPVGQTPFQGQAQPFQPQQQQQQQPWP